MDPWERKKDPAKDSAIRRWEQLQWIDTCPDSHLEWLAGICKTHRKPPEEWVENADIAARLLTWRRQGEGGPFR